MRDLGTPALAALDSVRDRLAGQTRQTQAQRISEDLHAQLRGGTRRLALLDVAAQPRARRRRGLTGQGAVACPIATRAAPDTAPGR
jgi:hypothetical protein